MKITVIGAGYVGLSNAVLLSDKNKVVLAEINPKKIALLRAGKSPIFDPLLQENLSQRLHNISLTNELEKEAIDSDFVVICTPTNFVEKTDSFDTSTIDENLSTLDRINFKGSIIVRATVPIGYTNSKQKEFKNLSISFFPEFLREGKALYDNFFPSRIVCGSSDVKAKIFLDLLAKSAKKTDVEQFITTPTEAESIKLFSNTFLAMRIAFFNELDTFAIQNELDTKSIIEGVSADSRIGGHYNNPSFGYGGYCLPKDTRQLLSNFKDIPQDLIRATIGSNKKRKDFIIDTICDSKPSVVGIYRLIMKKDSDNWRESSIVSILEGLQVRGLELIIFEPLFSCKTFLGIELVTSFDSFCSRADLIMANRESSDLVHVKCKVFSRDIFGTDA